MTADRSTTQSSIPLDAPELPRARHRPPYGREVEAKLESGAQPNVYLFVGTEGWAQASRRREVRGAGTALVLPYGADPMTLMWPQLDSIFVDARTLQRQDAVSLGAALIANGIRYAAMLGPRDEPMSFRSAA